MAKKIITIVGARPQFIKLARVSAHIEKHPQFHEVLIHTGQHYDEAMSAVFFAELGIKQPEHFLSIGSGSHAFQTAQMLLEIEKKLLQEKPDLVLVYGDTNSTLAGALTAAKLCIPIVHVESGLRSYNRAMPEEINRIVTDQLSDLLFAPSQKAVIHLQQEGIEKEKIKLVGDVMYDASLYYGSFADKNSAILKTYNLLHKEYILATIHRQENTDDPDTLKTIVDSLCSVAQDMRVVFPVHPRTEKMLRQYDLWDKIGRIVQVIKPVGFLDMIKLEKSAAVIATDSGGIQKEAYFHKVPCVTLRNETEWEELVTNGWNTLASPQDQDMMISVIRDKIRQPNPTDGISVYGDGFTAEKIVKELAIRYL